MALASKCNGSNNPWELTLTLWLKEYLVRTEIIEDLGSFRARKNQSSSESSQPMLFSPEHLLFFGLLRIRAAEVALVEGEFPGPSLVAVYGKRWGNGPQGELHGPPIYTKVLWHEEFSAVLTSVLHVQKWRRNRFHRWFMMIPLVWRIEDIKIHFNPDLQWFHWL